MESEELTKIIQSHKLWLDSGGKEGKRATLEEANFGTSVELRGADLRNAVLNRAEFKDADLTETNLQGAELRRASFDGAILRRTNLREADLQNANLENADFLLTAQLAGANVAGAKLPKPIAEFEGLRTIAEATSNGQKLFVAMLGGCLYSWLTIGTTRDAALLTNSASSPLPVIGTALPIVGFYVVAPAVLLAMYFYFHLNMQRLWEALADLPAVFPDGRSLDKKADPWLLNGLVSAHFARLRRERPALSRVQQWLSILLAWWVVPVTLFVFWGRFLPRHDWFGTGLHIGLLAAAIGFAWMSYRLACATLRGAPRKPFLWAHAWRDRRMLLRVAGVLGTVVVGLAFYFVSFLAIEGVPPDLSQPSNSRDIGNDDPVPYTFNPAATGLKPNDLRARVPRFLKAIGVNSFANLVEEDISTKPPNWTGDLKVVKGARLRQATLQYADAAFAFLVNADLFEADLRGAYLPLANLSNADLTRAKLEFADLSGADLSYAHLLLANLSNADLSHANLKKADLTNTDLSNANLASADLSGATLFLANLGGADLGDVKGLTRSEIETAHKDDKTILPANLPP